MLKHSLTLVFILSFFSYVAASAEKPYLITAVKVKKNKIVFTMDEKFKKKYLEDDLFIEYDEDIDLSTLHYSIITLPCVTHLLSLVWRSGKNYYIKSMDTDFFYSMKRLKKLFSLIYPATSWKGNLIPQKLVHNSKKLTTQSTQQALLFSGGLDSTVSSLIHRDKKQLLITAWGQWDLPLNDKVVWQRVKERLIRFAHTYGHESTFIRSNYAEFINFERSSKLSPEIMSWRLGTIENIGWAGMVTPLLYAKGINTLSIASSASWDSPYPLATFPFIDGNIVSAGIQLQHEQFDFKRADKVDYLVNLCKDTTIEKPFLTICQNQTGFNCCKCRKCLTTLFTLFMLNDNPQDYGFSITKEQAIINMKERLEKVFSEKPLHLADLEFLDEIRLKAEELTSKGIPIDREIASLINFNFQEKVLETAEHLYQKKMDWQELHEVFPHIEVPENYKQKKRI